MSEGAGLLIESDGPVSASEVVELFAALDWSSARFPERIGSALAGSHGVWTLRDAGRLVGLVTAICDGAMCVYFPYVVVHPSYQGKGWGRSLMEAALARYRGFHHVALISYGDKTGFYERVGFERDDKKVALFARSMHGAEV